VREENLKRSKPLGQALLRCNACLPETNLGRAAGRAVGHRIMNDARVSSTPKPTHFMTEYIVSSISVGGKNQKSAAALRNREIFRESTGC
jgi:hypothetical protein